MQGLRVYDASMLFDSTGAPVGVVGIDGREYLFAAVLNAAAGTAQPSTYVPAGVAVTGGTINGASIGVTTPAIVKTSNLQATYTDSSGTPGNASNSSPRGRAAFAAASGTVTITSTLVTAASSVQVMLGGADTTLTSARVTAAAGSFTVTGNAAATGATPFDFLVIN